MSENQNRAFMYGESVFTTLRVVNGNACDWEMHFDRLRRGVEFVFGPFNDGDQWSSLLKNRLELIFEQGDRDRLLRIAIYREASRGLKRGSMISVMDLRLNAQSQLIEHSIGRLLTLRSAPAPVRPKWWPGYLKAGNYLEVILAQKVYLKPGDDDLLFVTADNLVCESSVANIFFVKGNKLLTPATGPMVLEGVMRKKVIDVANEFFDEVRVGELTLEQLKSADAVFGTNSVRGPFLLGRIDDSEFTYTTEFISTFERLRQRTLT
jgi:branched-subunit amino acid aminotransferase/4-amino-4-deoxychorismate lyase